MMSLITRGFGEEQLVVTRGFGTSARIDPYARRRNRFREYTISLILPKSYESSGSIWLNVPRIFEKEYKIPVNVRMNPSEILDILEFI